MNIEEIKDSLQRNNFTGLRARLDSAIEFIDSQQAEIEALKAENSHLKYEISSGAWNPVKELTDEEKWEVFTNFARSPDLRADMIRFADSILRKAQEK
jgi:FtsZ-binding cell division protein ZapB